MSSNDQEHLISIVIPVFNRTALLKETINSVVVQSYQNWELIIVDDGSTEDVEAAVLPHIGHRLRLIRQANQGNAAARNFGLRHARGQFLICLDSDDVWHKEMLSACLSVLQENEQADVVYTLAQVIDGDGRGSDQPAWPKPLRGNLLEPLLLGHPILPSATMFRKHCLSQWGGYKRGLDDWELWLRWALNGCIFDCVDRPLLQYRLHDDNYALHYQQRRTAHLAMLESFYERDHLPPLAMRLKDQAYAKQYFRFAVLAWRTGMEEEGKADFASAVKLNPAILSDIDALTQLACAHQDRIHIGTKSNLNLDQAERSVTSSIESLLNNGAIGPGAYNEALAWGYFALARLSYSIVENSNRARHYLRKSVRYWPSIIWRSGSALWLARILLGNESVNALKIAFGRH